MSDEAFHEIQLNGKQLVFLFMAATVVAVVIFLCGVMVGRGVQGGRAFDAADTPIQAAVDPTAAAQPPVFTTAPAGAAGAPVTAQETLTYPQRLEAPTPPVETLNAAADATVATTSGPVPVAEPRGEPTGAAAPLPPEGDAAFGEPAGSGFVVQVAAVRERAEAEIIARRLNSKGYPTFVTSLGNGAPRVFRVRVGKYTDRREAESVASRLEKEEQFKPWITR